jgi:uncharacterized membrane protein
MKILALQTAALVLVSAMATAGHAGTYKIKAVGYKNDTTLLKGINTTPVITGDYIDGNGNGNCFIVTGKVKSLLKDPKGSVTGCVNINTAGTIVGGYLTNNTYVGYSYSGSTFTDVPGPAGAIYSFAYGINDKGVIVGSWIDGNNLQHGFILKGKKYTSFDTAGSVTTLGVDINNSGVITVQGFDSQGNAHSYLVSGNSTTELIFPGSSVTRVHAISNKGMVGLVWLDSAGNSHGGLYDSVAKAYSQIDVPGAAQSGVFGVNDKQSLVGIFSQTNSSVQQGFVATYHK